MSDTDRIEDCAVRCPEILATDARIETIRSDLRTNAEQIRGLQEKSDRRWRQIGKLSEDELKKRLVDPDDPYGTPGLTPTQIADFGDAIDRNTRGYLEEDATDLRLSLWREESGREDRLSRCAKGPGKVCLFFGGVKCRSKQRN